MTGFDLENTSEVSLENSDYFVSGDLFEGQCIEFLCPSEQWGSLGGRENAATIGDRKMFSGLARVLEDLGIPNSDLPTIQRLLAREQCACLLEDWESFYMSGQEEELVTTLLQIASLDRHWDEDRRIFA
ncbi:MAG: hypothetical protein QGH30_08750 [Candidatus Krumholzibacteria bacterium]|nr:hypothetical protein [Candidatus Krumholzibacteria bacterium]